MPTNLAKLCLAILILCQCEHLYEATTPATSKITSRNIVTDIIAKFFTSNKPKKKTHRPTFRPSFSPSSTPSQVKDDQDEPESDEVAPPTKLPSGKELPLKKPVVLPLPSSTATDEDPTDATSTPSKSPGAMGPSPKAGKKAPKLFPTAQPVAPDSKTDNNTDGYDSGSSEPKTTFPSSSSSFEAPSPPDEETMLPTASPKSGKKKKGKADKPSLQPTILSEGADSEKTKPGGAKDDSGSETGKNADDHADEKTPPDSGSGTGKNADDDADEKTAPPTNISGGGHKDDTTIGGAENINEEIKIEDSAALSGTRFFFYAFVFCMIFACVVYGMRRKCGLGSPDVKPQRYSMVNSNDPTEEEDGGFFSNRNVEMAKH